MGIFQSVLKSLEEEEDNKTPTFQRGNSTSSSSSAVIYTKVQDPPRCVYRPERTTPGMGSPSVGNDPLWQSLVALSYLQLKEVGEEEEEREEEHKMMIESSALAVDEERWINHYCSGHRILLVGEGDFSFSASLAVAFVSASNMIATCLNTKAFVKNNYQNAPSNIAKLRSSGCRVMHGIDATKMANHPFIGQHIFDRVIYNFPFAGYFKNLSHNSRLRRHRRLVSLFLMNAKEMIDENGEIHITHHKTKGFHKKWKIESIASSHGLRLIEAVDFNHLDYPGYNTKQGFGGDDNFNCGYPSMTYKFGPKKIRY